jgi:hypothetical protein
MHSPYNLEESQLRSRPQRRSPCAPDFLGEAPLFRAACRLGLLTAQRGGELFHVSSGTSTSTAAGGNPGGLREERRVTLCATSGPGLEDPGGAALPARTSARRGERWAGQEARVAEGAQRLGLSVPLVRRRTAASLVASTDTQRVVVQKILTRVETGVTAVCNRYSCDMEKRAAFDAWGSHVAAISRRTHRIQAAGIQPGVTAARGSD